MNSLRSPLTPRPHATGEICLKVLDNADAVIDALQPAQAWLVTARQTPQKTVFYAARVDVPSDDVSARIDPAGLRVDRSREVKRGELSAGQQETMEAARRVAEVSHDLFQGTDIPSLGQVATGYIEGLEISVPQEETMREAGSQVSVQADDETSIRRGAVTHAGRNVKHQRVAPVRVAHKPAHICHEVVVVAATVNVASGRDPLRDRPQVPGNLNLGEGSMTQQIPVDVGRPSGCIRIRAHNIASRADPPSIGRNGAGIINGSEVPAALQEPVLAAARIDVQPDDVSAGIDALDRSADSPREINRRENRLVLG